MKLDLHFISYMKTKMDQRPNTRNKSLRRISEESFMVLNLAVVCYTLYQKYRQKEKQVSVTTLKLNNFVHQRTQSTM